MLGSEKRDPQFEKLLHQHVYSNSDFGNLYWVLIMFTSKCKSMVLGNQWSHVLESHMRKNIWQVFPRPALACDPCVPYMPRLFLPTFTSSDFTIIYLSKGCTQGCWGNNRRIMFCLQSFIQGYYLRNQRQNGYMNRSVVQRRWNSLSPHTFITHM